jgi:hypothetical protein
MFASQSSRTPSISALRGAKAEAVHLNRTFPHLTRYRRADVVCPWAKNLIDKMAFLNDSVEQSPPPTILPPSRATSDSQVDLPIRVQKTLDSVPTITTPQEKITPLQQAAILDQADDARRYLQNRLAGQDLRFPERPREFILPVSSLYQLLEDPDFESDRKQ